jgi:tetratricopeptide (TPR) repeat protein
MSPRRRVLVIVVAAAAVAAGATVALAMITANDEGGKKGASKPFSGAPPLVFDLGVRNDREARALRRGERLYDRKQRAAAARVFVRYDSVEAQLGAALAAWPDDSLARLERLSTRYPKSSLILLHLGYARLWAGRSDAAGAAWEEAARAEPDSAAAQRADDALHPKFPAGQPFFVPSFAPPATLGRLSPPQQLAQLERRARGRDVRAKLLYGLALQRLGHRISARREYDAAARLAPGDPEARVAAAVARFDKSRPAAAFSRLGPLSRRFPRAPTVRFHLGLLLFWLAGVQPGAVEEAKRQLRLAQDLAPGSSLAREARQLLRGLENAQRDDRE